MKILANERKEMREIFQRETTRLEREDRKLHRKNDQLQRQNDEQKKEMEKQSQQMGRQSQEIQQLKEKLRHADVVAQNSLRQKVSVIIVPLRLWFNRSFVPNVSLSLFYSLSVCLSVCMSMSFPSCLYLFPFYFVPKHENFR